MRKRRGREMGTWEEGGDADRFSSAVCVGSRALYVSILRVGLCCVGQGRGGRAGATSHDDERLSSDDRFLLAPPPAERVVPWTGLVRFHLIVLATDSLTHSLMTG